MRAMAADPADRFATARQMREALIACLGAPGVANREHDVTASLATLMETPEPAPIHLRVRRGSAGGDRDGGRAFVGRRRRAVRGRDHRGVGSDRRPSERARRCRRRFPAARAPTSWRRRRRRRSRAAPIRRPRTGANLDSCSSGCSAAPAERRRASSAGAARRSSRRTTAIVRRSSARSSCSIGESSCASPVATARRCKPGSGRRRWPPRTGSIESNVTRLREQLDELRRAQRRLADWSRGHAACDSGPMTDD